MSFLRSTHACARPALAANLARRATGRNRATRVASIEYAVVFRGVCRPARLLASNSRAAAATTDAAATTAAAAVAAAAGAAADGRVSIVCTVRTRSSRTPLSE